MLNFFELKQKLPLANSDFGFLRKNGKCYVDKTEYIYLNLAANAPSVRAGIRPRVFSSSKTYINNKTVNLKWHGYCLYDKK